MYAPPRNIKDYPSRYFGTKRKFLDEILEMVPFETETFYDAFSGSGSVAFALNKCGVKVILSDVLFAVHCRNRALIQNTDVSLSASDIEMLVSRPAESGLFQDRYIRTLGRENARFLDRLVVGIQLLEGSCKRDIAAIIPILIAFDCLHYTSHTYSRLGGIVAYQNFHLISMEEYFKKWAMDIIPNLVVGNTVGNQCFQGDAVNLIKNIKADCAYIDPPYSSKPRHPTTSYETIYTIWEDWSRMLQGKNESIISSWDSHADLAPYTRFERIKPAVFGFLDLFKNAEHIPTWIISYNTTSGLSPNAIADMARYYGRKIEMKFISSRLPIVTKGADSKTQEVLIRATKTVSRAAARKANAIGLHQTILDCKSVYPAKVGRNSFAANVKTGEHNED